MTNGERNGLLQGSMNTTANAMAAQALPFTPAAERTNGLADAL